MRFLRNAEMPKQHFLKRPRISVFHSFMSSTPAKPPDLDQVDASNAPWRLYRSTIFMTSWGPRKGAIWSYGAIPFLFRDIENGWKWLLGTSDILPLQSYLYTSKPSNISMQSGRSTCAATTPIALITGEMAGQGSQVLYSCGGIT